METEPTQEMTSARWARKLKDACGRTVTIETYDVSNERVVVLGRLDEVVVELYARHAPQTVRRQSEVVA